MGVDIYGHSIIISAPCPVCGYATRSKHAGHIPCACNASLDKGRV